MGWNEIEKLLSPRLRFLEFIAALSPTPMYMIAKSFESLGLTKKYRAVLTDYERLIKKGIYVTYDCGSSKCVQVNIDLICNEFSKKVELNDDERKALCDSMKEFVNNLRFEPKVGNAGNIELLNDIIKNFTFYFFIVHLSISSLEYNNRINDKTKESIIFKIASDVSKQILENPVLLSKLFTAAKLITEKGGQLKSSKLLMKYLTKASDLSYQGLGSERPK
jgi:hypothetical protein